MYPSQFEATTLATVQHAQELREVNAWRQAEQARHRDSEDAPAPIRDVRAGGWRGLFHRLVHRQALAAGRPS